MDRYRFTGMFCLVAVILIAVIAPISAQPVTGTGSDSVANEGVALGPTQPELDKYNKIMEEDRVHFFKKINSLNAFRTKRYHEKVKAICDEIMVETLDKMAEVEADAHHPMQKKHIAFLKGIMSQAELYKKFTLEEEEEYN